jgi:hypothetical protein
VPGQQGARGDEPIGAQHGWQLPGQRRHDGAVDPVRLGPGDLTAEHRDLMTENHDLRILGRMAAAEQHQPAEDPDHDQVEQAKGHKPRSCRNRLTRPIAGHSPCSELWSGIGNGSCRSSARDSSI